MHELCTNTLFLIIFFLSALFLQGEFNLNEEDDAKQEYKRLQQAMEMVGFLTATKKR